MVAACGGRQTAPALQVTGVVIAADGQSAAQVDSFSLRTADGQILAFRVVRLDLTNGGLPSAHLREHLSSGEPIAVTYHVESDVNIADRYVDAPIDSPSTSSPTTAPTGEPGQLWRTVD